MDNEIEVTEKIEKGVGTGMEGTVLREGGRGERMSCDEDDQNI